MKLILSIILVCIFSVITSTVQAQQTGQITPENIYFNSYSIDRHGNIRLPYLGELNVLGYTEKEVREKNGFTIKE